MLRGSELVRIGSLVTFLGVVGMFMYRAADPAMWKWLDREAGSEETQVAPKPAAKPAVPKPPAEVVTAGQTDEDPEQKEEAAEEFQAVSDGSVGILPEEMFAYWRLFFWTDHQSFDKMRQRAQGNVPFTKFIHSPEEYRGRLVRMDLNVRRVLTYDVEDSPVGVERIYEIWGFTDDSKAWLYDVVTAHLPEGMPIGPNVSERVKFVGYFFKLQGYREAGAKPRDPPLRAPLLVGRLVRYPSAAKAQQGSTRGACWWTCGLMAGGAVILIGGVSIHFVLSRRAERRRAFQQQQKSDSLRQWLHEDFTNGDESFESDDGDSGHMDRPSSNGNHHDHPSE